MAKRNTKCNIHSISISVEPPLDDLMKLEVTKAILSYVVFSRGVFPMLYESLEKSYKKNPAEIRGNRKKFTYLKSMIRLSQSLDKASLHHISKVLLILGSNHIAPKQTIVISFADAHDHHNNHHHNNDIHHNNHHNAIHHNNHHNAIHLHNNNNGIHHHNNNNGIHHHNNNNGINHHNHNNQHCCHEDDEQTKVQFKKKLRRRVGKVIESLIQWGEGDDGDDNNHNLGVHVMVKLKEGVDDEEEEEEEEEDEEEDEDGVDDDLWSNKNHKILCGGDLLLHKEAFSLPKSGKFYRIDVSVKKDEEELSGSEDINMSGLREISDGDEEGDGGDSDSDSDCGGGSNDNDYKTNIDNGNNNNNNSNNKDNNNNNNKDNNTNNNKSNKDNAISNHKKHDKYKTKLSFSSLKIRAKQIDKEDGDDNKDNNNDDDYDMMSEDEDEDEEKEEDGEFWYKCDSILRGFK